MTVKVVTRGLLETQVQSLENFVALMLRATKATLDRLKSTDTRGWRLDAQQTHLLEIVQVGGRLGALEEVSVAVSSFKDAVLDRSWNLFLDDVRDLPETAQPGTWVVCQSVKEALDVVRDRGLPARMSLDHDLGENLPTGNDFCKELANLILDLDVQDRRVPRWQVHSDNPVGRANMVSVLSSLEKVLASEQEPSPGSTSA